MPLPSGYGGVKTPQQGDFKAMPDDVYEATIADIKLLENQPKFKNPQEVEDILKFEFTVTEEGEFKGTRLFSKNIRPIMSAGFAGGSPSTLYKIFCAVNNITLTTEESETVSTLSINELIGKGVRLRVKPTVSKSSGKTYNNVEDYLPLKSYKAPAGVTTPQQAASEINEVDVDAIPFYH